MLWKQARPVQGTESEIFSTFKFIPAVNITTEKASGIIKSVYSKSGKNYIDIDYVTINPNWRPGGNGSGPAYTNDNSQVRTFELSPDVKFIIDVPNGTSITFSEFQKIFTTFSYVNGVKVFNNYRAVNPWDIVIINGAVTQITEHYVP